MFRFVTVALAGVAGACASARAAEYAAVARAAVSLDTLGYLPAHAKRATIAAPKAEFTVVRVSDAARVFSGTASAAMHDSDTGQDVCVADFSAVRTPGVYRLVVAGVGESVPFKIGPDVYVDAFATVVRGMYLWRCGTAVSGVRDGVRFSHEACHLDDAGLEYATGEKMKKDFTGGWHDAGDYNKYVVNAGVTVASMLRAWDDFGSSIRQVRLGLPEAGGALPEYLAEIKWETDWLLKMQADDGTVYHKVSALGFGGFMLPEKEPDPRFVSPWSSVATANFVATLAAASRAFRPFDREYADRCEAAAMKSYAFLTAHPEEHVADLSAFHTGAYQTSDRDARLWAAAEIWETTGEKKALEDFEARARLAPAKIDANLDWGNVNDLGFLTYLFSKRPGRDAALVAQLRETLVATADALVATTQQSGYARAIGSRYYWGGNGGVARQTIILQSANRVAPKREYIEAALDAVHHLFGRNVHGRSYVTGLGANPPQHPHDRRVGGNGVPDAWPGYLVGGPNPGAADWHDVQDDYRTNEIAINWNAALIYALAGFLSSEEPGAILRQQ